VILIRYAPQAQATGGIVQRLIEMTLAAGWLAEAAGDVGGGPLAVGHPDERKDEQEGRHRR
jgi:hypothetical protein